MEFIRSEKIEAASHFNTIWMSSMLYSGTRTFYDFLLHIFSPLASTAHTTSQYDWASEYRASLYAFFSSSLFLLVFECATHLTTIMTTMRRDEKIEVIISHLNVKNAKAPWQASVRLMMHNIYELVNNRALRSILCSMGTSYKMTKPVYPLCTQLFGPS